uniref:Solute carrier family 25 member 44 n=1 Tax=Cajanus cajan TaxID=3821 RepID=A0A151RKL8_CAJCA|nr:Solute carrier family 25 member 44 [Cajanus cajan]
MLDKSKFFILGGTLFSGLSAALYPIVVLKTRQQVSSAKIVPLYISTLELTKTNVAASALGSGFSDASAAAMGSAAGGVASATAAQIVWTPVDVVSQRLMVERNNNYRNGLDAFRRIACVEGARGLYRGFGVSVVTYAPCNAVWWGSYSVAQRVTWGAFGEGNRDWEVQVQGLSAVVASGVSAIVTMPLDTVKTRLQVQGLSVGLAVRSLVKEGGVLGCYRGLGARWVSMSVSAATMITTYEFLKRVSAKKLDRLTV